MSQHLHHCTGCSHMQAGPGKCPHDWCENHGRDLSPATCRHCKLPMISGEMRYTGGEIRGRFTHAHCKEKERADLDRSLRGLPGQFNEVGNRLADLLKKL